MTRRATRFAASAVAALCLASLTSGCVPLVLGGAGVAINSSADQRTLGAQIDDEAIVLRIADRLHAKYSERKDVRWNTLSHNGNVVLAGQVDSKATSQDIESIVRSISSVKRVDNELEVGGFVAGVVRRSKDAVAKTAILKNMVLDDGIPAATIQVMVEDGVVHIAGAKDPSLRKKVSDIAREAPEVRRVVMHF